MKTPLDLNLPGKNQTPEPDTSPFSYLSGITELKVQYLKFLSVLAFVAIMAYNTINESDWFDIYMQVGIAGLALIISLLVFMPMIGKRYFYNSHGMGIHYRFGGDEKWMSFDEFLERKPKYRLLGKGKASELVFITESIVIYDDLFKKAELESFYKIVDSKTKPQIEAGKNINTEKNFDGNGLFKKKKLI